MTLSVNNLSSNLSLQADSLAKLQDTFPELVISKNPAEPRRFRWINEDNIESKFIHASGSGQFSLFSLNSVIEKIRSLSTETKEIVIVNLCEESRFYVNGLSAAPKNEKKGEVNKGKTVQEITIAEKQHIEALLADKRVSDLGIKVINNQQAITDLQDPLVSYKRIPITDHNRPTDPIVDDLTELMLNSKFWCHFHCEAGRGRTGLALLMEKIIHSSKTTDLETLIKGQKSIGGEDLAKIHDSNGEIKPARKEKLDFIENYYKYCRECITEDLQQTKRWSDWAKENNIPLKMN